MPDNNPGESRKKLKVDLAELVFEMEMGENMERSGYLDTETGEIISMPDDVMRAVDDGETGEDLVEWDEDLAEIAGTYWAMKKIGFS